MNTKKIGLFLGPILFVIVLLWFHPEGLSKEANALRVYTITGKTVLSYNSKNSNYNVSSLSKGIYFAEATFDSGKKVFKFIKE